MLLIKHFLAQCQPKPAKRGKQKSDSERPLSILVLALGALANGLNGRSAQTLTTNTSQPYNIAKDQQDPQIIRRPEAVDSLGDVLWM